MSTSEPGVANIVLLVVLLASCSLPAQTLATSQQQSSVPREEYLSSRAPVLNNGYVVFGCVFPSPSCGENHTAAVPLNLHTSQEPLI